MKLKTLKDLIIDKGFDNIIDKNWVNANDLKQEAIKWIKYRISNCVFSCRNNHEKCKEHKFWMERFNITEEDLK